MTSLARSLLVARWLERQTTVRKVMGSIPAGVVGGGGVRFEQTEYIPPFLN